MVLILKYHGSKYVLCPKYIFYSFLLTNLSQTASNHDLTAANNRFVDGVLVGINIIIIRPIWCPVIAIRPILLYNSSIDHRYNRYIIDISSIYRSGSVRLGPARSGSIRLGPVRPGPEVWKSKSENWKNIGYNGNEGWPTQRWQSWRDWDSLIG